MSKDYPIEVPINLGGDFGVYSAFRSGDGPNYDVYNITGETIMQIAKLPYRRVVEAQNTARAGNPSRARAILIHPLNPI